MCIVPVSRAVCLCLHSSKLSRSHRSRVWCFLFWNSTNNLGGFKLTIAHFGTVPTILWIWMCQLVFLWTFIFESHIDALLAPYSMYQLKKLGILFTWWIILKLKPFESLSLVKQHYVDSAEESLNYFAPSPSAVPILTMPSYHTKLHFITFVLILKKNIKLCLIKAGQKLDHGN